MGWENSRQLCKPETKSRVCITVENSANPSRGYIKLCKHRKKVFYCFYKIFLKMNSTNEGILFIDFLIQKDFLNTRSIQWSFLLTNQKAHLITHEPMKFRVTKVKLKFKSPASKRASCKWKRCQLWILLNLWEKCLIRRKSAHNYVIKSPITNSAYSGTRNGSIYASLHTSYKLTICLIMFPKDRLYRADPTTIPVVDVLCEAYLVWLPTMYFQCAVCVHPCVKVYEV